MAVVWNMRENSKKLGRADYRGPCKRFGFNFRDDGKPRNT